MLSDVMLSVVMLSVIMEYRCAENHYAECRGAPLLPKNIKLSKILTSDEHSSLQWVCVNDKEEKLDDIANSAWQLTTRL
jgi:hypothetical protein